MNRQIDDITLSSYVDGELDAESMREVESFLENDSYARKYVINAVRINARLRESMNKVMYEEIPEHLISAILPQQKRKRRLFPEFQPLFRMAAAIMFILLGFGAGSLLLNNGNEPLSTLATPFPASYNRVVNDAMEHNLSGTPHLWQSPEKQVVITVIPVKTYRDKNGQYFREYSMEVQTETARHQINGLAYRKKGEWKTKAVYYQ